MESSAFFPLQVNLSSQSERQRLASFLARSDLRLDEQLEYCAVLCNAQGEIVCCGGFDANTIKCVAASEEARGEGLVNILISHLRSEIKSRGADSIFIYTKPENRQIFESLAFYTVGTAPKAIMMESSKRNLKRFKSNLLNRYKKPGLNGAIVMNANPFTLGHLHLVQEAAKQCDHLYVFPVRADRSIFPFQDRLRLVEAGCASLPNVEIMDGGDYIISGATFPTYFLKKLDEAAETQARLVLDIFAEHIAPSLGVQIRFVGSEPLDPFTAKFNQIMLEVLPQHGVQVQVIERLKCGQQPISASRVRALLQQGKLESVKELVPSTTFAYLNEPEGERVIKRLRSLK
ncbi:MAG: [citrate (pro-3S)-lyase] ligase [Candidatus Bruticola sp.]